MALSVNTNSGAMAALQSLSATNRSMETTQSRINTGLAVASTKDDSAKYTVAQNLRGDLGSIQAVTSSLNNAKSQTDVAVAGVEQISDLVNQMKSKTAEAADSGLDDDSRAAILEDLTGLKDQINTIINASDFNGKNLLKTGGGDVGGLRSIQDGDDTDTDWQADEISVSNIALDADITTAFGDKDTDITLATAADAETLMGNIETLADTLNTNLSTLGAASRQIEGQLEFNSNLTDVVTTGIGNLVDADLAKESANLQALQVKQQLGVQALSIANQSPQTLLSLFK